MNLLLNARDAIDERNGEGEIKVVTCLREQEIIAEISDNGVGIAPENVNRVFDPFFSTKTGDKGTGLGLAVSYSIVAAHGGRISIAPKEQGTIVTIAFPEAV